MGGAAADTAPHREEAARRSVSLRGTTRSSLRASTSPDGKPSLPAVRVEKGPAVDGRLDDEAWDWAPIGGPLLQWEPNAGAPMTEQTEFRVVYDDRSLYLGFWCYDSHPEAIRRRVMERDGNIFADDYIYFVLDTFHDQRNGYVFVANAMGARWDALVSNNVNRAQNWDGVWRARATVDAEGWKLEIEIPFRSINFDPETSVWGFNVSRGVKRKFERGRWTAAHPGTSTQFPSEAGDLTGLAGLTQGLGLEAAPYLLGRFSNNDASNDNDLSADFGIDVRYRVTPKLSTTLSYNTDFAEAEVDQRQINFSRFPLFFPERRAFFLEDSGAYEFGGLGVTARNSLLGRNLIPFFSRRVGRSADGEIVPITLAGKVSGRAGPYTIGLLDAALKEHAGLGTQNAFVGRVSRDIWRQSSYGLMLTHGDPNSDDDNALIGPDFRYRTTDFLGDKTLEANAFALITETENAASPTSYAYGAGVFYPNDLIRAGAQYMEIDSDFNPALGFVRRRGARAIASTWSYRPRPDWTWLRQANFRYDNTHYLSLDGSLDSSNHDLAPLWLELESGDEFWISVEREFDSPDEDFSLSGGATVPAGDYEWTVFQAGADFASQRMLSGDVEFELGEFYDGRRSVAGFDVDFLPWKRLGFEVEYAYNRVSLPSGAFDTHITAVQMFWNFDPEMVWSHLVQYDSISESFGLNSRFQWEYRPGTKLFVVLNHSSADTRSLIFDLLDSQITMKAGATFRF